MPYIGNNHIAGDHTNNFKVLDDISSFTATFDGSATSVVDTTNNTIRVVEHRFIQGQRVTYTNGSGGNIGGLTTGTAYFVIFDTANTIKLATNASNAASSTAINLSAVGTGSSHTLNVAFDGVNTKFKLTHGSGTGARLNNSTQINVAINNVVQRPNLDPNNFTDGFALEDNHKIVFQTAPTSQDIFWGSIIANTLTTFDISDHKIDTFTGDGSTTEFTLSHTPANNESLMVTINGVLQHPSNASTARAYTLIASIIQFTAAPGVGDEIQVRHLGFAGATTSDVSGFYGRTGNVVLTDQDDITVNKINVGTGVTIESNGQATFVGVVTFGSGSTTIDNNVVNVGTALTLGHTQGLQFHTQNLHSAGFEVNQINSSGIITASSLDVSGNAFIGGVLTYEDVTSIDSVGLITARDGIDCNGDLDVDGHTNLDNVSVAGVTTFTGITTTSSISFAEHFSTSGIGTFADIHVKNPTDTRITSISPGFLILSRNNPGIYLKNNLSDNFDASIQLVSNEIRFQGGGNGATSTRMVTTSSGVSFPQDIDVDGHTNLDNVSVAGVTTFAQNINLSDKIITNCKGFNSGNEQARIVVKAGDNSAGGGLRIVEYYNDDTTLFSSEIANFYTNGIELKENVSITGNLTIPDSIIHSGDTDTKIEFSTDTINFDTAGGERLRIASDGSILIGGIRTSNTGFGNKVLISGGTLGIDGNGGNAGMHWHRNSGDTEGYIGIGGFAVTGGADDDFGIAAKGNLIFGTASGGWAEKLRIASDGTVQYKTAGGKGYEFGASGSSKSTAANMFAPASYTLAFATNNEERLRISQNGQLLHGDSSEDQGWAVFWRAASGGADAGTAGQDGAGDKGVNIRSDMGPTHLDLTGTDNFTLRLSNGAYSGTGVADPQGTISKILFHTATHNGWNSYGAIALESKGTSSAKGQLVFLTNNGTNSMAERLRITNAGYVGVNESSPQRYFQVTGNASYGAAHFGVFGTNAGNAYIGNTPVVTISTDGSANAGTNDEKAIFQVGRGGGGAGAAAVTKDLFRVNLGGSVQIGGVVGSNSDIDIANTKLTIKQTANNKEDGIYLERSGERRGYYMYVGGAGGYNDALSISMNQLGTDTDVLAIDRGNRLAKLGGDVIIDSSNNGYGGLRIYDDTSGGYNVNYLAGRNDGNTSHVFWYAGRTQNQSPWSNNNPPAEMMRVSASGGLQLAGDTDSGLQFHAGDHYKFRTKGRERVHVDNRGVMTAPKLSTKALVFSSCCNKWASSRDIINFVMTFYTGASSATYHFMRMISQPDWSFDDVEIRQYRYQYNPSGSDHTVRRYYSYYGGHNEQIVRYNQNGSGTGTSNDNYITKRTDFGPGGSMTIHQASNGGYYRDLYGSDYAISLGNYIGVRLEIKITATVGVYDTGDYATAYDFYPANYGGQATQTNADNHGGPRGVWFNTTSNGTGTGTAPVISTTNSERGWSTGSNFLDVSA